MDLKQPCLIIKLSFICKCNFCLAYLEHSDWILSILLFGNWVHGHFLGIGLTHYSLYSLESISINLITVMWAFIFIHFSILQKKMYGPQLQCISYLWCNTLSFFLEKAEGVLSQDTVFCIVYIVSSIAAPCMSYHMEVKGLKPISDMFSLVDTYLLVMEFFIAIHKNSEEMWINWSITDTWTITGSSTKISTWIRE